MLLIPLWALLDLDHLSTCLQLLTTGQRQLNLRHPRNFSFEHQIYRDILPALQDHQIESSYVPIIFLLSMCPRMADTVSESELGAERAEYRRGVIESQFFDD